MVKEKIGMKDIGLTISQVPSFKIISIQGLGLVGPHEQFDFK